MSLESARVKVETEHEEWACSVKREPALGPELLHAPDVACPPAGTSAATCVVKQEFIVEEPSEEGSAVGTEVSVLANSCQEHAAMQGLDLDPECVKQEDQEKEAEEEFLCGVSEAAARAGLYAGHAVKRELVLGPELLQAPDIAYALKEASVETANTASPALTASGASGSCPGEGARSRGLHIELKACFVSLERIAIDTRPHTRAASHTDTSRVCRAGRATRERSLQAGLGTQREYSVEDKEEDGACGVSETNAPRKHTGRSASPRAASQALAASGARGSCPGEGPRCSESRPEQRARGTCSLERMSTDKRVYTREEQSASTAHPQSVTGVLPSKAALGQHKQAHTADKLHSRIHTGDKQYACDVCKRQFTHKHNLNLHKCIHTGEKPYACDVCKKQFSHSGNLIEHKRIHTGEKPYACDVCKKQFSHSGNLIEHKRIHTGEKPYACDVCKKQFTVSSNLIKHKRIHTGERQYECHICKKQFSRSSNLIVHKRVHTGEKPYACDICNKQFSQSSSLSSHKRIHTGAKPYECDICNKQFAVSGSLVKHKRIHTGARPYECDICKKQFAVKHHLNEHTRIHRREKSFECDICNKQFTHRNNLVVHIRKH